MEFRAARESELTRLEAWQPTGLTRMHARRFGRQVDGRSTYMIAWADRDQPVASCEIRWDGCAAPEVRVDCPELNGLQVWPEPLQGHGIGTKLIGEVERLVVHRGIALLGLGVDETNSRAASLYLRLGYKDTGIHYVDRYFYITDDGVRHDVGDPCRFLVKTFDVE